MDILYENDGLVVVCKPAGLLCIPGPDGGPDLTARLDEFMRRRDGSASVHVHPCHRLDRDTSGVMVFARGKALQKQVMAMFAQRQVVKIYLCVVNGVPERSSGTIRLPLDGKPALTQYQVLAAGGNFSVLKCKIHTGRTNQIRLHCAGIGHPLVGDDRFGRRKDFAFAANRTLLHSWFLQMPSPVDAARTLQFMAPVPQDMQEVMQGLGLDLPALPADN